MNRLLGIGFIGMVLLVPAVTAQSNGDSGDWGYCMPGNLAQIVAVVNAGPVWFCINTHDAGRIGDSAIMGATWSGPLAIGAIAPTWTNTIGAGCTASGSAVMRASIAGATFYTFAQGLVFTDTTCTGSIRLVVTVGAVTIYDAQLPWTLVVRDDVTSVLDFGCASTGSTQVAYAPASTSCTAPTVNNVNSGTVTQAGTLNVVNSGGQNIAITSWPTLNAVLSGGLTITDDANGWSITSTNALSGTINVVNSGGQTVAVSSWPALIATLTGNLNVHQDEACGATTPCLVAMSGNGTSASFNTTVTNDFAEVVLDWFPLWFGIIGLFVAIWRREGLNPDALIGASVAFFVAMFTCPFPAWTDPIGLVYRVLVFGAGLWSALKWGEYGNKKQVTVNEIE